MKISASELVKRSASQLIYKEVKKLEWESTPRQSVGNVFAEEIVKKEQGSAEKRGIINIKDDLLFFCVDMVKENKLIEIKMIEDENNYEDWYLYSSLLQATYYATLATKIKTLDTPKFRKKEGYSQEIIQIPDKFTFELWFGNFQKYQVYPNERIYNHYLNKIKIIKKGVEQKNWDNARIFDSKFKFKEFSIYKPKFKKLN
jgi:hypothetical protein